MLFKGTKIALFSDLHIGVHRDSCSWHKVVLDFADWFVRVLEDRDIQDIVFCGDFFHTRHEIEQMSLMCGVDFLKKLSKYNMLMLPGNHCSYFKNNSSIHSLAPFKEWDNITVYDEYTLLSHNNRKYAFCPWGTSSTEIESCDVAFGHFEIVNFKMNMVKICDHGESTDDLINTCKRVVTGHFHIRDHRNYDNDREVLYLGSPFEMDFSDRDTLKGVTILDTETLDFEFIINDKTPRHYKLNISDFVNKKITSESLERDVRGNIICIVVDVDVSSKIVDAICTKINQYAPFDLRVDYNVFTHERLKDEIVNSVGIDIPSAIGEFIDLMSVDISKQDILNKTNELYERSILNEK